MAVATPECRGHFTQSIRLIESLVKLFLGVWLKFFAGPPMDWNQKGGERYVALARLNNPGETPRLRAETDWATDTLLQ